LFLLTPLVEADAGQTDSVSTRVSTMPVFLQRPWIFWLPELSFLRISHRFSGSAHAIDDVQEGKQRGARQIQQWNNQFVASIPVSRKSGITRSREDPCAEIVRLIKPLVSKLAPW